MYEYTCEGANNINKLSLTTDDFDKFSKVMTLITELDEENFTPDRFCAYDYIGEYVMHCNTKEKADIFCEYLHRLGRTWVEGDKYLGDTCWDWAEENTAYEFNEGAYCDIDYYKERGYTILEFDDFDWNN